jgi:hypothetical protein
MQINSTILMKFSRLLTADWGVIYIITCKNSCHYNNEQNCIEEECDIQIEDDALVNKAELEKELDKIKNDSRKKD